MAAFESGGYQVKSAQVTGNLNSSTAVINLVTGKVLSLKRVCISASAAANFTIENVGGVDILGPLYFAANGGCAIEFAPGARVATSGVGVNVLSSTTDVATCYVECWVL